ncbi:MAG: Rpn family recombination-promoting nuclease/putative transposase [Pseudomonadota bacterium]
MPHDQNPTHKIHNPHDRVFKAAMKHAPAAKEFLQTVLPQPLQEAVQWQHTQLLETSFVDEQLQHQESDLIFELKLAQTRAFCYCLIEHQSSPDRLMPLRMLNYVSQFLLSYTKQAEKPPQQLPAVYPVIFYHGNPSPYPYPLSMQALSDNPLIEFNFWSDPIPLLDIEQLDDEEIFQHQWLSALVMVMKRARAVFDPEQAQQIGKALSGLPQTPAGLAYLRILVNYLYHILETPRFTQTMANIHEQLSNEQNQTVQTMAQSLREEGQKSVAINLLKEKMDVAFIAKVTGLSIEKVEAIKNEQT